MLDPLNKRYRPFLLLLQRKRRNAFLVLTMEKAICHTWRLAFWTLFFSGLWMLALPSFFGTAIEIATLLIFIFGIIYFIRNDLLNFELPKADNIDKRLEKSSHLGRGYIAVIEDGLANPAIINTRLLWHKARRDALFNLKKLRLPYINPQLFKKDPYALRFIALLVFISGFLIAGHQWKERIINGLFPNFPAAPSFLQTKRSTDIWITPPDYTRMPKIHLSSKNKDKDKKELDIPEGSKYRIRMQSAFGKLFPARLHMGETSLPLNFMEGNLYGIEGAFKKADRISISQGLLPHASWPYRYIIDTPPEIHSNIKTQKKEKQVLKTSSRYEILENKQVSFPLIVKDDYAVKELRMHLRLDEIIKESPLGEEMQETRLVMSQPNDEFHIAPIYDFTSHIWAGLPISIEFTATDQKGQSTSLDKIYLKLPEKSFKHPVAQKLAALRKEIAWNYKNSFKQTAVNIEELLNNPNDFQGDIAILLAIRSAASRLYHNDEKPEHRRIIAAKEVISLLWEIALVIEEGDLMLALRELRNAQRALENAMLNPDENKHKIQSLMDELREKMANYFTQIQREMQKRVAQGKNITLMKPEDFGSLITPQTISNLMAQIQKAIREGDKQKAQKLVSEFQRMMDMIDPSSNAALPEDMKAMHKGINELQEIIKSQESLKKQTRELTTITQRNNSTSINPRDLPALEQMLKDFGMNNVPPAPAPSPLPAPATKKPPRENEINKLKIEQETLRKKLGEIMLNISDKLEKIPENIGKAEQDMRSSTQKLEQNKPSFSLPYQSSALQNLKKARESMSEAFRQRMQKMVGIGLSGTNLQLDPLGRPYNNEGSGKDTNSSIKIPDKIQKKRVDDIIKQLHRRSGDRSRTREELEYYRRLLRQF